MQIIILAGGKGTRLWPITENIPKPMVEVAGQPFLAHLLRHYSKYNMSKVCIAVGYKHDVIMNHFSNSYNQMELVYSIEENALGTGGAVSQSLPLLDDDDIVVTNGDTFFNVDLNEMMTFHLCNQSDITIAVKPFKNYERYGTVLTDKKSKIIGFKEKMKTENGLINCGTYIVKRSVLQKMYLPLVFSFETDVLETNVSNINEYAFVSDGYFIDIGIHEDLERAQTELEKYL